MYKILFNTYVGFTTLNMFAWMIIGVITFIHSVTTNHSEQIMWSIGYCLISVTCLIALRIVRTVIKQTQTL